MEPLDLFDALRKIGAAGQLDSVRDLTGAGNHRTIERIADIHRRTLAEFFERLSTSDQIGFVKALAIYEDTVGGLGSVTMLRDLLPYVDDPDHTVLDWVLRNTNSYWYYSHNTRSYAAYQAERRWRAKLAAMGIQRDEARQAEDRKRIAAESTAKLYNAVRRKDLKAVRALITKGADPSVTTPDGQSLTSLAASHGQQEIVVALEVASRERSLSSN